MKVTIEDHLYKCISVLLTFFSAFLYLSSFLIYIHALLARVTTYHIIHPWSVTLQQISATTPAI